ncbi:MAG: OstA family protein [Gammaproteobacteria bacterium]|nr:OstA family protein [Gammaproteobacteria bacterium]
MKSLTILLFASLLSFATFSAEVEKFRVNSEQSFADLENNNITYQGNVRYSHGSLLVNADKLVRVQNDKQVTVSGSPVEVTYVDPKGEQTKIFASEIRYWEDSGEILATGNSNDAIRINQTSKSDRLKLTGRQLKANRKTASGFSFTLTGSPTRFELQRPGQPLIEAKAGSLSSNGKGRQTLLNGNVQLRQGDSLMAAASMLYDGETELISAQQSADGSQRVETEFFWDENDKPQDKKEEQENP